MFRIKYQNEFPALAGYTTNAAFPDAFVVTVAVTVLLNKPVLVEVSEGILLLVNSGNKMEQIAYVFTPSNEAYD